MNLTTEELKTLLKQMDEDKKVVHPEHPMWVDGCWRCWQFRAAYFRKPS